MVFGGCGNFAIARPLVRTCVRVRVEPARETSSSADETMGRCARACSFVCLLFLFCVSGDAYTRFLSHDMWSAACALYHLHAQAIQKIDPFPAQAFVRGQDPPGAPALQSLLLSFVQIECLLGRARTLIWAVLRDP